MKRIVLFLLLLVSVQVGAAVNYEQSFESGTIAKSDLAGWGYYWNVLPPDVITLSCFWTTATKGFNSFETSTKYAREGTKSIRVENHGNLTGDLCNRSDTKQRAQIQPGYGVDGVLILGENAGQLLGQERWYATSFYFPGNEGTHASWWSKSDKTQILQIMANGNSNTPELALNIYESGKIMLENRYRLSSSSPEVLAPRSYGQFQANAWNDVVVYFKRLATSSGVLKVWINGTLVMNRVNTPVAIATMPNAFANMGLYYGTTPTPTIRNETYVSYMDSIVISDDVTGTEQEQYDRVKPGGTIVQNPNPVPTITSVNGGAAIAENTLIQFIGTAPKQSFLGCQINNQAEKYVNWNHTTGASGYVNSGSFTGLTSSSAAFKCYYEPYDYLVPVTTSAWSTTAPTTEEAYAGISKYGYTTGFTTIRSGTSTYSDSFMSNEALNGTTNDNIDFEFTYSCESGHCDNLNFTIGDKAVDNRLQATGSAGSLDYLVFASGFGSGITVTNRTLGEGVYRVIVSFTETAFREYKPRFGSKSGFDGQKVTLHSLAFRKNAVTESVNYPVIVQLDNVDNDNPDLSNCSLSLAIETNSDTYEAGIKCDTNELGGTANAVIKTTNSPPADAAAVQAATGAAWAGQAGVNSSPITFEAGGFSYQDLWAWVVQCDAADNCSDVSAMSFDAQAKTLLLGTADSLIKHGGVAVTDTIDTVVVWDGNPVIGPSKNILAEFENVSVTNGIKSLTEADLKAGSPSLNSLSSGNYWVTTTRINPETGQLAITNSQKAIVLQ